MVSFVVEFIFQLSSADDILVVDDVVLDDVVVEDVVEEVVDVVDDIVVVDELDDVVVVIVVLVIVVVLMPEMKALKSKLIDVCSAWTFPCDYLYVGY